MDSRIMGPKNNPAIVTPNGALLTHAISYDARSQALMYGSAFAVLTEVTLTDTAKTPLMWLRNEDLRADYLFVLDKVIYSANANVYVEMEVGNAYTSGGADATPSNLNGKLSSVEAAVTVKKNTTDDLVLGAGLPFSKMYLGANSTFPAETLIAIPNGVAGAIFATGAAGNHVTASLLFHFESAAEHQIF